MRYGIYLRIEGRTYQFPVNPQSYQITYPVQHSRYQVLGTGEVIIPRAAKLRTVEWEGVFPTDSYYPARHKLVTTPPKDYIQAITNAQKAMTPVQLIINRYLEDDTAIFDDNFQVLIEDFSVEERGGQTGDFYYKMKLTEYQEHLPKQITTTSNQASAITQREIPQTQLVVGCTVRINGKYWTSSEGAKPFGTAANKLGKISRMITTDPSRAYPIHVTDENGGALGWVSAGQVQRV